MDPEEKVLILDLFRQLARLSVKGISKSDKNYVVLQKKQ